MFQKDKDGLVITTKNNTFCFWLCKHKDNHTVSLAFGTKFRFIFTLYRIWKHQILGLITEWLNPHLLKKWR